LAINTYQVRKASMCLRLNLLEIFAILGLVAEV
jgi:hypothetical protein